MIDQGRADTCRRGFGRKQRNGYGAMSQAPNYVMPE